MSQEPHNQAALDALKAIQNSQSADNAFKKRAIDKIMAEHVAKIADKHSLTPALEEMRMLPPRSLKNLDKFITQDEDMLRMKEVVTVLAEDDDNSSGILIHGETGTGKEIIASALHGYRKGKFLAINTTSLPDELLESELFGHVKGSFTGAYTDRVGKLVAAHDGTVFLDEIGDMKPNMQEKLLRALEERCVTPVGSNEEVGFNCRVVAATHKDLEDRNRFREDLYWRLATYIIKLKPLRHRQLDILEIAKHLHPVEFDIWLKSWLCVQEFDVSTGMTGNVRELKILIKREILRRKIERRFRPEQFEDNDDSTKTSN